MSTAHADEDIDRIGIGGGCHWCTEGVFQTLKGVASVEQGYIRSLPPADSWAEAVLVTYDRRQISLRLLIEVHVRTHRSTAPNPIKGRYRSAVYAFDTRQQALCVDALAELRLSCFEKLTTLVLMFKAFKSSPEHFKNYYRVDPDRPFCKRFIDPKLSEIRRAFPKFVVP